MSIKRGDIVLVRAPDTSGAPGKLRPVLIVSSDHNNRRLQDVIVAVITSTTKRAKLESTQLLIQLVTSEGRRSGLLNDSAVKCERLHTNLQKLIKRTIGSMSVAMMLKIDNCLKSAMGLPRN
jgi:mRNA-degrading endonuclease toxin of MazEF toxin-antitoxin module